MANPGTISIGILVAGLVLAFIGFAIYRQFTKNREQQMAFRSFGRPSVTVKRSGSTDSVGRIVVSPNTLGEVMDAFRLANPRWSIEKARDRAFALIESTLDLAEDAVKGFSSASPVRESVTVHKNDSGVFFYVTVDKDLS